MSASQAYGSYRIDMTKLKASGICYSRTHTAVHSSCQQSLCMEYLFSGHDKFTALAAKVAPKSRASIQHCSYSDTDTSELFARSILNGDPLLLTDATLHVPKAHYTSKMMNLVSSSLIVATFVLGRPPLLTSLLVPLSTAEAAALRLTDADTSLPLPPTAAGPRPQHETLVLLLAHVDFATTSKWIVDAVKGKDGTPRRWLALRGHSHLDSVPGIEARF
ncbi:hypothetical protein JKP88DRAFT_250437 [Tribonema minus]|uniref:Uncharacterized protein n=1 Tax=Tribonema minus TaxID=303371 RepID=A0A835YIL1_9STRA|nr:hypothetical protein JKP88DRAFT_250437 [Tribonema minus]